MTSTPPTDRPEPRIRKDVLRNRARLLAAADELLASRGLELTFHELANAAGVGVGTVYRHFADKDELLGALVEQRFTDTREILLAAEAHADPIEAFRAAVLGVCGYLFADRATLQATLSGAEGHRDLANELLLPVSTRIIDRAVASGRLRPDFSAADLPMIFLLAGGVAGRARGSLSHLWRRYVDAVLDGFMTMSDDRVGVTVPAPTQDDVSRIAESAG